MAIVFVNEDWSSQNPNTWKASNSWFNKWHVAEYSTNAPSLTLDNNAFSSFDGTVWNQNAGAINHISNGDTICLCNDTTYKGGEYVNVANKDFTIISAYDPSNPSHHYTLTIDKYSFIWGGNWDIDIKCNMTIDDSAECNIEASQGITLQDDKTLTVNGTLTGTQIKGDGDVTVGPGATLTVSTYSAGDLTVGDGANVTITNYSGGTIVLTGEANLNITNGSPKFDISINPETSGVLPYKHLLTNNSITFNNSTIPGISSKPVIVTDNGHSLYYAPKNFYYVNSSYTGEGIPSLLSVSGMSKTTVAAATTAAGTDTTARIFVTGNVTTTNDDKAIAFNGLKAQILGVQTGEGSGINNDTTATFGKSVAGGAIDSASAGANMTINGGTFSKTVVGGDFITSTSATHIGDIKLTINGGTFGSVGGGMAYTEKNPLHGAELLQGDIDFTITGGTFNRRVYGGSLCSNIKDSKGKAIGDYGDRIQIVGDVNLTIDAKNTIAFSDHIVAGSYGTGAISGSTTVTFKGDGAKLGFTGIVCGGSGATYFTRGTCHSFVSGNRTIAFDGFSGNFAGQIKAFKTAEFTNDTTVKFTNASLNLKDIEAWSFEAGSSLKAANGIVNDFTNDSIALTGDWTTQNSWTLAYGSADFFTGFDVTAATGVSGYSFALQNDSTYGKKLVLAKA